MFGLLRFRYVSIEWVVEKVHYDGGKMNSRFSETDSRNKIAESRSIYTQTKDKNKQIKQLEKLMKQAAEELDFMAAAKYRDEIIRLKENKN